MIDAIMRKWHGLTEETITHSRFSRTFGDKPKPFTPVFEDLPDLKEYQNVAEILGFEPPQIKTQQVERLRRGLVGFMLDNGFPIYNNNEVHAYMKGLAENHREVFVWNRLDETKGNSADRHPDHLWDAGNNILREKRHGQFLLNGYKHPVPLNILKRAALVKKQYPTAEIYVSDYAVVDPDPFICARYSRCEHIVFGMWDEPGFKAIGRDA